jgi:uncharacterized membrane protein
MFETTLVPHRSLSPAGYRLLIACLAVPNCLLALYFLLRGAWPVAVLAVLLVAALHLAFRRNFAEAGRLRERLTLDERDLVIEQVARDGSVRCRRFNRYWVRVAFEEEDEDANCLRVGSHGRFVTLGAFLSPGERKQLAGVLQDALRRSG